MNDSPAVLRFVPSRVEGLPDVSEAAVYHDRVELMSAGRWVVFPFASIARWPRPYWLWRALSLVRLGCRWLPVADRNWFCPPRDRYFVFYTTPPVKVCMPNDEQSNRYAETYFVRMQQMIQAGGFSTFDLG